MIILKPFWKDLFIVFYVLFLSIFLANTQIKSNAVRALGNLSRFVAFTDHSISSNGHGNSCSKLHILDYLLRS